MINQIFHFSNNYGPWITATALLYWTATTFFIIKQDREPAITISWIFLFMLMPLFAPALYYLFGRNWPTTAQTAHGYKDRELIRKAFSQRITIAAPFSPLPRQSPGWHVVTKIMNAIQTNGQGPPLPGRDLTIFSTGSAKFDALLDDISRARQSIHMQYFIWSMDSLTATIARALKAKLTEGVQVRILNDYIGCLPFPKTELKDLARSGALVAYDVAQLSQANYRDHRKITVIDGKTGYTGGMNMAKEYIDGKPRFNGWRDTHVRFRGPLVTALQQRFAERWYDVTKEDLFREQFFPSNDRLRQGDFIGQIVTQEVQDHFHLVKRVHEIAITSATRSVRIQSPYFVPDEGTMDALIAASIAGVRLQLMMTGIPDKRLPFMAAKTYWEPLIRAGGHIYLYTEGFLHAKTITVDGIATAFGSLNVDCRSLKLHKELMMWIYDPRAARQQEELFDQDLTKCKKITQRDIDDIRPWQRLANSSARLVSHLL